jgi:hypothetical protein
MMVNVLFTNQNLHHVIKSKKNKQKQTKGKSKQKIKTLKALFVRYFLIFNLF